MICFLQGVVVEKRPTSAVLDVGGVGYEVLIPLSSYDRLPAIGSPCRVLTHDHVREDQHVLFGFMTEGERRLFVLLMSATGVGPKLALSALSGLSVRELTAAIVEGNVKRLSTISGIGRKTAERLVVELKDRISEAEALEAVAGVDSHTARDARVPDAVLALIALGYKREAAHRMVAAAVHRGVGAGAGVEDLVKLALSCASAAGGQ